MAVSVQNRKMTRQEAGRKGGEKVARERGPEFYRQIGRKGGEKVAEERGTEFYREIGRKGGENRSSKKVGAKGRSNQKRGFNAGWDNQKTNPQA